MKTIRHSPRNLYFIIITFCILYIPSLLNAQTDPYEPNNSMGQSYPLQLTTTIFAYIDSSTDVDWFSIGITDIGSLTITLSSLPADYDVQLYSPNGSLLTGSYNGGTTSDNISYTPNMCGIFYIKVFGSGGAYNSSDSYRLDLSWTSSQPILHLNITDQGLGTHEPNFHEMVNVTVTNNGGGNLTGNFPEYPSWVSQIQPSSFNLPQNQYQTSTIHVYFPSTSGPFQGTVQVSSNGGNQTINLHGTVSGTQNTVASPVFNPSGGSYPVNQSIFIATTTIGATIYVTDDGSEPTQYSPAYGSPISLQADKTFKARAFLTGWNPSPIVTAVYTISGTGQTCNEPSISPASGSYQTPLTVSMQTSTPNSVIRYTIDGSNPNEQSTSYSSPFQINQLPATVNARAFKTEWNPSAMASRTYTLDSASMYPVGNLRIRGNSFESNGNGNYVAHGQIKIGVQSGSGIIWRVGFDESASLAFNTTSGQINLISPSTAWTSLNVLAGIDNINVEVLHAQCSLQFTGDNMIVNGQMHVMQTGSLVDNIQGQLTIDLVNGTGTGSLSFGNPLLTNLGSISVETSLEGLGFSLHLGVDSFSYQLGDYLSIASGQTGFNIEASYENQNHLRLSIDGGIGNLFSIELPGGGNVGVDWSPVSTSFGFIIDAIVTGSQYSFTLTMSNSFDMELGTVVLRREIVEDQPGVSYRQIDNEHYMRSFSIGMSVQEGSVLQFTSNSFFLHASAAFSIGAGVGFTVSANIANVSIQSSLTAAGFNFTLDSSIGLGNVLTLSSASSVFNISFDPLVIEGWGSIANISGGNGLQPIASALLRIDYGQHKIFLVCNSAINLFGFPFTVSSLNASIEIWQDGIDGSLTLQPINVVDIGSICFALNLRVNLQTQYAYGSIASGVWIGPYFVQQGLFCSVRPGEMQVTVDLLGHDISLVLEIDPGRPEAELHSLFSQALRASSGNGEFSAFSNLTGTPDLTISDNEITDNDLNDDLYGWIRPMNANLICKPMFCTSSELLNRIYDSREPIKLTITNDGLQDTLDVFIMIPTSQGNSIHRLFRDTQAVLPNTVFIYYLTNSTVINVDRDWGGSHNPSAYEHGTITCYYEVAPDNTGDYLFVSKPTHISLNNPTHILIEYQTSQPSSSVIYGGSSLSTVNNLIANFPVLETSHYNVVPNNYKYLVIQSYNQGQQLTIQGPIRNQFYLGPDGNEDEILPKPVFRIFNNYPNPFSNETTIKFETPLNNEIFIRVFNIRGQVVKEMKISGKSGMNSISWDGTDKNGQKLASGVYLYQINCGSQKQSKKLIIMKN